MSENSCGTAVRGVSDFAPGDNNVVDGNPHDSPVNGGATAARNEDTSSPPRRTRATSSAQKAQRRQRILDAAAELAADRSYANIAMSDVAQCAGVAKGTLYLYFPTREALFLDLFRNRLNQLLQDMSAALAVEGAVRTPSDLANIIVGLLAADDLFTSLAAILHTELEYNIDADRAIAFKAELRDAIQAGGAAMEQAAAFLPRNSGAAVLLQTHALMIGYAHIANPTPVIAEVLKDDSMAIFRVDFVGALTKALTNLLAGAAANS